MTMTDENGSAPPTQVESIMAQLRELVANRQEALTQHDLVRDQLTTELRQAEKALAAFTGERKAGRPKGQPREPKPTAARPKGLSNERLAEIEQVVRKYAVDHEEFRQVDVRGAHGQLPSGSTFSSSISALAFEELRQRNVIRVARIDGNSKFYRLTREALA